MNEDLYELDPRQPMRVPTNETCAADAAAPSDGSDSKNITPTNDSDAENMPLNDSGDSKKKDSNRATQKDRGHATREDHVSHEAETGKTDEESGSHPTKKQ
ncbi:hypothetical protein VF21_07901 [Pseudogymnoascus sp. 05NY08]|nr:hypothetical protein VF21_07901 [Pseudogymnoascus sp. 05NY08]